MIITDTLAAFSFLQAENVELREALDAAGKRELTNAHDLADILANHAVCEEAALANVQEITEGRAALALSRVEAEVWIGVE